MLSFFFLQFSSHRMENWRRGTYQWFDDCYEEYYFKNECVGFIRFPNTRKLSKARGCRPSALIVFDCLETLMKLNARVLEELLSRTSGIKEHGNIHEFFTCFRQVSCCYSLEIYCKLTSKQTKKKRKKTKNRQKKRRQKTTKTLG